MHTFADSILMLEYAKEFIKSILQSHSKVEQVSKQLYRDGQNYGRKRSFAGFATHDQELIDELLIGSGLKIFPRINLSSKLFMVYPWMVDLRGLLIMDILLGYMFLLDQIGLIIQLED